MGRLSSYMRRKSYQHFQINKVYEHGYKVYERHKNSGDKLPMVLPLSCFKEYYKIP